ncbi:GntR family transcriptional regulator [Altererythrobacter arenosus]|uniref:GntR family transcriptional regulator n=1 Tax=Altererythrobacter arenosus TaxID=3032592 RepID=A0ABY8FMR5_9SPHN|nr:GntR family transcriptional regulator [Altererythrobacter sp. CAU 1644]WFL76318.1 GntR family transcriptional regulator [Altererythrobacter sp. CAU 1644]
MNANSSDIAYRKLRDRILDGELKGGTALKERDLCAELGISRTPVREALRRLSADGLVDMQPRRSIRVSSFGDEELAEIYEMGNVLQSHVTGMAARKATKRDLGKLQNLIGQMEEVLGGKGDKKVMAFARLDHEFHNAISDIARNARIAQIINQTISLRLLTNVMDEYSDEDFARSIADHRDIVAALAKGDEGAAANAMSRHVSPRNRTPGTAP